MTKFQLSLELILAFDQWATERGFDVTSAESSEEHGYQNIETQAAWLGFFAAHADVGLIRQGQQLYGRIKKNQRLGAPGRPFVPSAGGESTT